MKRGLWLSLAGLLAFAGILLARLPAGWVLPLGSKAQASCASIEGTLWSGGCGGLTFAGSPLGDLTWDLRPLKLLALKLDAHVTLEHGAARGSADVQADMGGTVLAHHLLADLPLDPQLLPGLPAELHGQAHVDLPLLRLQHGAIRELQGRIEARNLEERSGNATPLGSYVVTFPGGTDSVGAVRDLDGPLQVTGTLRLTPEGGFDLQGMVAPRPGAPEELINNLRFLGTPDAAGRRPFAMSGTF